ncbi:MAG: hypothetical protein L3J34_08435 [Flavobacteriaceae bacterium]|nr:hypothetical protein [Flavobacteriaceae bacterium]
MMYLKFILPFFLLLSNFVSSQKDYEKGYIITNQNEMLIGYVKDRKQHPFGKLYKKIRFKSKLRKRKYGPNQILGYKQGSRTYESLWVDVSAHLINEKYKSIPNQGEKEFLRIVVKGHLTYYEREFTYPDSDYIDHISLFKRAGEDSFIRVTQGVFGLRKRSLRTYFKDCPELVKKIEEGKLKTPSEVATFYNACKSKKPKFKR